VLLANGRNTSAVEERCCGRRERRISGMAGTADA
jgi:hypothetical protein